MTNDSVQDPYSSDSSDSSDLSGFGLPDGATLDWIVFSVRLQRVSGYLDRRHAWCSVVGVNFGGR
ncbi:hypothetical protein PMAA_002160 [Talaromyces marneffei ATCC 18224]|uniref:Uncharacterized protein n=1 Tax=Talaromyces marneffei (strain ATCC 18224 / CBS 334.59 / QM 7333) TaxID=441960 RepID=B6QSM7_TALMQ|nr:hypothetical protein PMAA_002160 [Talaromyces marneffei ATCC 18224]